MSYRSILVHVPDGADAAERVRYAARLAERYRHARLTGLFLAVTTPSPALGPHPVGELQSRLAAEAERRAGLVRTVFEQHVGKEADWRQVDGDPVAAACREARRHDLLILGQHDGDGPRPALPADFVESTVLRCGRPALVLPCGGDWPEQLTHALVAWDGSREAVRAMTDALPLLRESPRVTLLCIDPDRSEWTADMAPGDDAADFLSRRGIHPIIKRVAGPGRDTGEMLLSLATEQLADLLVMGLYGHGRLRERMLGGVSRTVLATMKMPVLMSH
ncbi:universal stress protein [Chitinimonas koreensis]|uniref:universal stress protein n=1 Tax=Chitinimonas koreensis TaxID=356302 RepID=UPI00040EAF86|nr:universal stress protein [Chitinimonas koreensis]QNM97759.1 universal stress protein [Chitinimonas koreensis]